MKPSLLRLSVLILLFLSLVACNGRAVYDTEILELFYQGQPHLSGNTLLQSNEAFTAEIEIKTNISKWHVSSKSEWLEVTQVGNYLHLKAERNKETLQRSASIMINAGDLSHNLIVQQAAAKELEVLINPNTDQEHNVTKETVIISENSPTVRLMIKSSSSDWVVFCNASWLQLLAKPNVGELVINPQPNRSIEARIATINLTSNGITQQIVIKQKGVLHFFLPIIPWGGSLSDINEIEKARQSKLVEIPRLPTNTTKGIKDYTYESISAAFPTIKYEFLNYGNKTLYAATLVGDADIMYSEAYIKYLQEEEGFKPTSPITKRSGLLEFFREADQTRLYLISRTDAETKKTHGYVYLYPYVTQPKPYKTLDHLELGIDFAEATFKKVAEWEKAHGGEYDDDYTFGTGLELFFAPNPFYARWYYFEDKPQNAPADFEPLLIEKSFNYLDHTLGVYRFGDLDFLTNEFTELLKKEGFMLQYFNPINRNYRFFNKETRIAIIVKSAAMGPHRLLRLARIYVAPTNTPTARITAEELENDDIDL